LTAVSYLVHCCSPSFLSIEPNVFFAAASWRPLAEIPSNITDFLPKFNHRGDAFTWNSPTYSGIILAANEYTPSAG
jgi:hypothetical protein